MFVPLKVEYGFRGTCNKSTGTELRHMVAQDRLAESSRAAVHT